MMTNSDATKGDLEGQIFLSHPHTNKGFFFLLKKNTSGAPMSLWLVSYILRQDSSPCVNVHLSYFFVMGLAMTVYLK